MLNAFLIRHLGQSLPPEDLSLVIVSTSDCDAHRTVLNWLNFGKSESRVTFCVFLSNNFSFTLRLERDCDLFLWSFERKVGILERLYSSCASRFLCHVTNELGCNKFIKCMLQITRSCPSLLGMTFAFPLGSDNEALIQLNSLLATWIGNLEFEISTSDGILPFFLERNPFGTLTTPPTLSFSTLSLTTKTCCSFGNLLHII